MAWKGFNPNLMQEAGRVLYPDQGKAAARSGYLQMADRSEAAPPHPVYPGGDPIFERLQRRAFRNEGPYVESSSINGGPTNEGISQNLLDLMNNKTRREWKLPSTTKELTPEQREGLYWQVFYKDPQVDQLARIPDLMEEVPEFVEHGYDTWVMTKPPRPGQWLQESLDEVLKTDLRTTDKSGNVGYQGFIRRRTREAIAQALDAKVLDEVNDRIADKR